MSQRFPNVFLTSSQRGEASIEPQFPRKHEAELQHAAMTQNCIARAGNDVVTHGVAAGDVDVARTPPLDTTTATSPDDHFQNIASSSSNRAAVSRPRPAVSKPFKAASTVMTLAPWLVFGGNWFYQGTTNWTLGTIHDPQPLRATSRSTLCRWN